MEEPMISLTVLGELFDYNYWARDRQLEACATLTPEQFLRPLGNSFSSLRDTLAHLVGAEWIWLERWLGHTPRSMPSWELITTAAVERRWRALVGAEWIRLERWLGRTPRSMSAWELITLAAVEERWRAVERDMRQYLAGLSGDALPRPLTYVNLKGETWTYPLWRTLLHLVNHQTYHRGQVTTLLRQLGAKAPAVDFLVAHDLGLRK